MLYYFLLNGYWVQPPKHKYLISIKLCNSLRLKMVLPDMHISGACNFKLVKGFSTIDIYSHVYTYWVIRKSNYSFNLEKWDRNPFLAWNNYHYVNQSIRFSISINIILHYAVFQYGGLAVPPLINLRFVETCYTYWKTIDGKGYLEILHCIFGILFTRYCLCLK